MRKERGKIKGIQYFFIDINFVSKGLKIQVYFLSELLSAHLLVDHRCLTTRPEAHGQARGHHASHTSGYPTTTTTVNQEHTQHVPREVLRKYAGNFQLQL